jgi:predicted transposase/invertase (TIGR01784 family)
MFTAAEIAKLTQEEYQQYIDSLKAYRDWKNSLETAKDEGKIEGKIEAKLEIAQKAMEKGLSIDDIVELTGLSIEQIKEL